MACVQAVKSKLGRAQIFHMYIRFTYIFGFLRIEPRTSFMLMLYHWTMFLIIFIHLKILNQGLNKLSKIALSSLCSPDRLWISNPAFQDGWIIELYHQTGLNSYLILKLAFNFLPFMNALKFHLNAFEILAITETWSNLV